MLYKTRSMLLLVLLILSSLTYAQPRSRPFSFPQAAPQTTSAAFQTAALQEVYETAREGSVRIETPSGVGSGFVISEDGLIMTAYHVVRDARDLRVVLADGGRYPAALIGFDEYADRALLYPFALRAERSEGFKDEQRESNPY